MAKLVLSLDGAVVYQCFVDSDRMTVGREAANRIVIDDPTVSREHAAIVPVGNDHILEDLASANGTFVNGVRVPRRILQHGDVIELGRFQLRYVNPRAAADADLERTMLIPGLSANLPGPLTPARRAEALPLSSSHSSRKNFPNGRVKIVSGACAGEAIELLRVVAVFGTPGASSALIVRRPQGYYLQHVEGWRSPRVNGRWIGKDARLLGHGDVVEIAGQKLEFAQDRGP